MSKHVHANARRKPKRRSSSAPSARRSSSCACSSPTSSARSRTSRFPTASSRRRSTARSCSTARRSKASCGSKSRTCTCSPTSSTFRVFPWAGPDRREGRADDLRHLHARRRAVHRLSRGMTLKKVIALAAAKGYQMKAGPEAEFFLFQTQNGVPDHRNARRRELLRPEPGRPGRRRPPRDRPRARGDGLSRRGGAPRGRAGPARDRLPLRRCADDGGQHQHVPLRREERRDHERPARDVHAQADLRHQRLGHAHAHVAVRQRHQHLLRRQGADGSSARPACTTSAASCATPRASARSPTRW